MPECHVKSIGTSETIHLPSFRGIKTGLVAISQLRLNHVYGNHAWNEHFTLFRLSKTLLYVRIIPVGPSIKDFMVNLLQTIFHCEQRYFSFVSNAKGDFGLRGLQNLRIDGQVSWIWNTSFKMSKVTHWVILRET